MTDSDRTILLGAIVRDHVTGICSNAGLELMKSLFETVDTGVSIGGMKIVTARYVPDNELWFCDKAGRILGKVKFAKGGAR